MRKILYILLAALCLALPAAAQTPITVSATVTDPLVFAYSYASVQAQIIPSTASPTITIGSQAQVIQGLRTSSADVNGKFSMTLWCNTAGNGCSVISPTGTQWQFTICATGVQPPLGTGPQCFTVSLNLSGANGLVQDISATLNASAPRLTTNGVGGVAAGTGTAGTLARWATSTTLGNSILQDDGFGTVTLNAPGSSSGFLNGPSGKPFTIDAFGTLTLGSTGDIIILPGGSAVEVLLDHGWEESSFSNPTASGAISSDFSIGNYFSYTLTGNVTSSTFTNIAGRASQIFTITVCQDGTGGRTFVPPAIISGWQAIATAPNACTTQTFIYNGTTAYPLNVPAPLSVTFANLGTPANGTLWYCSDCTIANPCAGSGTGAFAKRLNGVWVCN